MSEEPEEEDVPEQREAREVDPALLETALENFRAIAKGNGLKPEDIELKEFEGELFDFRAFEIFKIETSISEKHVHGREDGESAGSYTDAQQKIKAAVEKMTLDKNVKKLTINLLKKRKDIGFGIDGQIINFERMAKKFVIREPCTPCDTQGKITCSTCRGKKLIICSKCQGQSYTECHVCHGSQTINTPQGQQQCTHCHGQGQIGCNTCKQTGEVPCSKCNATGTAPCRHCSSTGWNSHLFHVGMRAKSRFDFERIDMPEDLLSIIDRYRTLLVTRKHAQVRIIEASHVDEEMDTRSEGDEYIIPYHVKIPWGDIDFSIKGRTVKGKLFGFNALIMNMPPVIEKIIGSSLRLLKNAAHGNGKVAEQISNAIRARAVGDAFLAFIPNSQKKAVAIMKNLYPYGIDPGTLEDMVLQAGMAMKHLTKKPRIIGLAIGATITAAFYGAYFTGPLRSIIIKSLSTLPDIIPDAGTIIISGIIITAATQLNATKALKKAIDKIINEDNKSKIMPKLSKSILSGYLVTIILFCAFLAITIMTGGTMPEWYWTILEL